MSKAKSGGTGYYLKLALTLQSMQIKPLPP